MKDDDNERDTKQVKIKIDDSILSGQYANKIGMVFSSEEIIVDYISAFPPEPCVVSRIIMSPGHFKRILAGMNESLKNYEKQFGEIKISSDPTPPDGILSVH